MAKAFMRRPARFVALAALPFAYIACDKAPPPADTTKAPAASAPVAAPAAPAAAATPTAPDSFRVAFETSKGTFLVQVNRAWAPKGADRFYDMVKQGYFTDVRFFRVVPGFVAQFGMHPDPKVNNQWRERRIADDSVRQSNKRGTIVFASQMRPETRANQFFINLGDNAALDARGFPPIGVVVGDGMTVVDKIYQGYGETPDQGRIGDEGNAYLTKAFPKMDYIKSAKIVR